MDNPIIYENGNKLWYNEKGQLHREDGPAYEYHNGYKEYWINGKQYNSLEEALMDQALK